MKTTRLPALAVLVLLAGCQEQETIPLSRSVPVAVLQVAVLGGVVGGGWFALEALRRSRSRTPAVHPGRELVGVGAGGYGYGYGLPPAGPTSPASTPSPLATTGAVVFWLVGAAFAALAVMAIASTPGKYAQPDVYDAFSWQDTVALNWILIAILGPLVLFELRLGAAFRAGRRWAAWAAGVQLAVAGIIALRIVGGSVI